MTDKCSLVVAQTWSDQRVLPSVALGNEKIKSYASSELQSGVPGNTCAVGFPKMTISTQMAFTRFYNKSWQ